MNQLALELDGPRLSRQCAEIVALLNRGPATNRWLADIALNYSGRISDLRHRGFDIRVIERDHGNGLVWYALFVNGKRAT
jgi:hypothetical protein